MTLFRSIQIAQIHLYSVIFRPYENCTFAKCKKFSAVPQTVITSR